jgi:hypothetical protein
LKESKKVFLSLKSKISDKTDEQIDVFVRFLNRIADRKQFYESYKDAAERKMKILDDISEILANEYPKVILILFI